MLGANLMAILKQLATNEFTVKDNFHFPEETTDQQSNCFMGSLDVHSRLNNIRPCTKR